jgi:hypothetical protein
MLTRVLSVLIVALSSFLPFNGISATEISVAVGAFDTSGAPDLDSAAGALLGDLVATELSTFDDGEVVDRVFLDALLDEQSMAERFAELRALTSARTVIRGQIFLVTGRLMVTARATSMATGDTRVAHVEGLASDGLTTIARQLAIELHEILRLQPTEQQPNAPETTTSLPSQEPAGLTMLVHVDERSQRHPSQRSVTLSELAYGLVSAGVLVYESKGSSTLEWLEAREAGKTPPAPFDNDVDRIVVGRARPTSGRRTGKLVTVDARLEVRVVSGDGGQEIAKFAMDARGAAPRVSIAANEALRNAGAKVVKKMVSDLRPGKDN